MSAAGVPGLLDRRKGTVKALGNLPIHSGPGLQYQAVGMLTAGQLAKVNGITPDMLWYRIDCSPNVTGNCWIDASPAVAEPVDPSASLLHELRPAVCRFLTGLSDDLVGLFAQSVNASFVLVTQSGGFGLLVPGAPAGLGVREGVLLALVGDVMPAADAVVMIALLRAVTTLGDLVHFAAGGALLRRLRASPGPAAAAPPGDAG